MKGSEHILIISSVWPEPNSSAAGARMMQLIELFQSKGWRITYASPATDSEHMFDIQNIGVKKVSIELNSESFDVFIQNIQPSIVLFDRFMVEEQFGWRVAEHCPKAMRILDTIDLHCLRTSRQKAFKENRTFTIGDLMLEDVAKREIASILRCDLSLIISSIEMDLLKDSFKVDDALLHYLPFMLDPIDNIHINHWKKFEERNHFISIGNFLHEPNWNAVLYLKETIWPLIRKKLPHAELHIYGAYPSQKVYQLQQPKQGFFIMGRAQNALAVMENARVCLAPLRFGAGLKGKLIEAMLCGTPSVTTDIGAEAMHGRLEWNGIIANNAEDISNTAVKLFTDFFTWEKAQRNGVDIINTMYPKTFLGEELIHQILSIKNHLEKHRLKNFTGSMLMHHTMASTKYMSRWIEAKNKPTLSN